MLSNTKSFFREIFYGLRNFWRWRKTIWNDRNYDYYFIYEVLQTKLRYQMEHMRKNGFHENSERDADDMAKCIALIENLKNENYFFGEDMKKEIKLHEEKKAELFKILNDKIEYWWD